MHYIWATVTQWRLLPPLWHRVSFITVGYFCYCCFFLLLFVFFFCCFFCCCCFFFFYGYFRCYCFFLFFCFYFVTSSVLSVATSVVSCANPIPGEETKYDFGPVDVKDALTGEQGRVDSLTLVFSRTQALEANQYHSKNREKEFHM